MKGLETRKVLKETIDRTIGERDSVLFREVLASEIPHGVKSLLRADLAESLLSEFGSSPRMDKIFRRESMGEGIKLTLSRALVQEYRFDRKEFITAVERAVEFLARYLCQPRLMMEQWIFGFQETMPADRVERKLGAIADYRYLPVLITRVMRKKNLPAIERSWFRNTIADLDDRVVEEHSHKELLKMAKPIFDFARFGSEQERAGVPLTILRDFFFEKNRHDFWKVVERLLEGDRDTIAFPDFLRLGYVKKEKPKADDLPPAPRADDVMQEAEAHPQSAPVGTEKTGPEMTSVPPDQIEGTTTVLRPLSDVMTREQERVFVNGLFGKDDAYFKAVLASLDELHTWKDAALYLSEFYRTNNLDPFADDVVEFTDVIHRRFEHVVAR